MCVTSPNVASHRSTSPPSNTALALLRSSLSGPYPPNKPASPPLEFNLEVVESPPTSDQMSTIMSYLPTKRTSPSAFLSAHPASSGESDSAQTFSTVSEISRQNPNAMKWPIVVDWSGGQASIGDVDGVKGILEILRQKRDGELKEEAVDKPKGWFS